MAMTNADFRSLIKGGNTNDLNNFSFDKKRKADKKANEIDQKREKRKTHYLQIQKKKIEKEKSVAEESDLPRYKDRAEERRQCRDDFYKQVADEYREMNDRSIEESKYLGGDSEHTHLVKGLDYALLSKVRSELEEQKKELEIKEVKARQENKKKGSITIKTMTARHIYKLLFQEIHPHHLSFSDKLHQMNYFILKGLKFKGNSDSFLPGRMCYQFDTRTELREDIPTVIFRSKQDCADQNEGTVYYSTPKVVQGISEALKWHALNKKKKKQERLPRRPGSNSHSMGNLEISITPENINSIDSKKQHDDQDDIYSGIEAFNPDEMIKSNIEMNKPNSFDNELLTDPSNQHFSSSTLTDSDFNSRYKMDIIRDEQGMEVDDDAQFPSQVINPSFYPIPAGIDPNSSMGTVYTLNYNKESAHDPLNHDYFEDRPSGHYDFRSIPYVAPETGKILRSGMTTTDQDRGFHSVYKRDEDALKKRGDEDEREKDPAYISDTYMECYPGFGADVSYEAYDSDDDEDKSKMDMGRLKQFGAKRREDFAHCKDWEQYQQEKEALPKAAFQYGRKMDDNRVTRRKKKLNADEEWKKIEKIMGDKDKNRLNTMELKISQDANSSIL